MATYEAIFADGLRVTFEADTMTIEEGVIVLMREGEGSRTAVAAIGADELLFIRDTSLPVTLDLGDDEDEEDEDDEEEDEEDEDE